jgi:hypothetical protein
LKEESRGGVCFVKRRRNYGVLYFSGIFFMNVSENGMKMMENNEEEDEEREN